MLLPESCVLTSMGCHGRWLLMVEDEPVVASSKWFHFLADGGCWYTSSKGERV